jgi:quinolinate synthase
VERLAEEYRDRVTVKALSPSVCANMARTNENNLLEVLEKWPARNEIHVDEAVAGNAAKALNRMLSL